MKTGEFLSGPEVCTVSLSPQARELKRRMFDCFKTQQHVLEEFSIAEERFRLAPVYDFSQPPHEGQLYYEDKGWGVASGSEWRRLAMDAAEMLSQRSRSTSRL